MTAAAGTVRVLGGGVGLCGDREAGVVSVCLSNRRRTSLEEGGGGRALAAYPSALAVRMALLLVEWNSCDSSPNVGVRVGVVSCGDAS